MALNASAYLNQLKALLPRGRAWIASIGNNNTQLLAAIAEEYARVDSRVEQLINEADPRTTNELLPDWERVAGLPSPCVTSDQTIAQRRAALIAKLTAVGGQTPAYYIEIAGKLGFNIAIKEHQPRRHGQNYGANYGGEEWAFVWDIITQNNVVFRRRFGLPYGESYANWSNTSLECPIRALSPAHTLLRFVYLSDLIDWPQTTLDMLQTLYAFMMRYVGGAEPFILSSEFLVRNNMHPEIGRGGYLESGAATTEGQSLNVRGWMRAAAVTSRAQYASLARNIWGATTEYFFFGATPDPDQPLNHHWLVNAGADFESKGPVNADNTGWYGVIGETHSAIDGVIVLNANLANVYRAFSSDGALRWHNVFSELVSGSEYTIANYVDKYGYVHDLVAGTSVYDGGATPGMVTLATSFTGNLKINYALYQPSISIAHAQAYEAWPMWRERGAGEYAMATDTIHWFLDAVNLLITADPGNTSLRDYKSAFLNSYLSATVVDSYVNSAEYIFMQQPGVPYDSVALTYFYNLYADGSTSQAPIDGFSPSRDVDGYVTFDLPYEHGREFVFENGALYLNYNLAAHPDVALEIDIKPDESHLLAVIYTAAGPAYEAYIYPVNNAGDFTFSLPLAAMLNWQDIGVWKPIVDGFYEYNWAEFETYSGSSSVQPVMDGFLDQLAVRRFNIPFNSTIGGGGFGFSTTSITGFATAHPPVISYATIDNITLTIIDADGWRWACIMPHQATLAARAFTWSDFILSSYQTNSGLAPSAPNMVGNIQTVQFGNDTGVVGLKHIDIRYISTAAPLIPTSGQINKFQIRYQPIQAIEWDDGSFVYWDDGSTVFFS